MVVLFGVEDDVTDQFTVFGDNVHVVVHHVETYGLPATFPADIEVSRLTEVATSHARVGRRRRDGRGGRLPTSRARACATSARPGSASTTRNSSEPEPTGQPTSGGTSNCTSSPPSPTSSSATWSRGASGSSTGCELRRASGRCVAAPYIWLPSFKRFTNCSATVPDELRVRPIETFARSDSDAEAR